ncbi:MAG: DUF2585 domain-containing protein, partial [Acidobacteria bacterium]|nr:DUF2585 domain-containing protein [Acidobacteriota bacterium]
IGERLRLPGAVTDALERLVRHHLRPMHLAGAGALTDRARHRFYRDLGPDGKFGWWDGNIWSSENSQRVADANSFSHIVHGILFFALLWLSARKLPLSYRFTMALLLEAGWEVLENSPIIINRYREATIALIHPIDTLKAWQSAGQPMH